MTVEELWVWMARFLWFAGTSLLGFLALRVWVITTAWLGFIEASRAESARILDVLENTLVDAQIAQSAATGRSEALLTAVFEMALLLAAELPPERTTAMQAIERKLRQELMNGQ